MRPRLCGLGIVAQRDLALGDVMNDSWTSPVDAHEAKAAYDVVVRKMAGEKVFVADPVLQSQENRAGLEQGGEEFDKSMILRAFQSDNHQITGADAGRVEMNLGRRQMEVTGDAVDVEPVLFDSREVAPHEEVDIESMPGQTGAVVAADSACADNGNFGVVRKVSHERREGIRREEWITKKPALH